MIDPALDPLGAVEAAMLARLKSSFGWDDDKRALRQIKAIEFPFDQGTDKVMQLERLTVFGVTFFGKITHDFGSEDADLAPFLRFHADWDIAPVADPPTDPLPVAAPDAADDVTLEGDHS